MFTVDQICVFLENRKGALSEFSKALKDNGVDLISLSIADTREFGIVRIITDDNERAIEVLRKNAFIAKIFQVLGILVDDTPGGISYIFDLLEVNGISVEYAYSLARQQGHQALIILKVSDSEGAVKLFTEHNVKDAGQYFRSSNAED